MKGGGVNWKSESDDLERVIEKSDTSGSINSDDVIRPHETFRERLAQFIHSGRFQIAVVVLVIIDCLLVIGELMIDLNMYKDQTAAPAASHNRTAHESSAGERSEAGASVAPTHAETEVEEGGSLLAAEILHFASIAILSIFLVELCVKLFAMGKSFFHHKMEIVDGVIVIVSFGLDIGFMNEEDVSAGLGLLVVLRLWRIGRVVNGIVLSVKTQAEKKIAKEKALRQAAETELEKFREYCAAQEREVEALQILLSRHNIQFQKMEKPVLPARTIDVVAEVNQYIEATRVANESDAKS